MSGDLGWPTSKQFWNDYAGQLTPLGCQQLISVGADLRSRYLCGGEASTGMLAGLLDGIACEQAGLHVLAYCSNFQRTLFSAWSLLHGLMPEVPRHFCSRSERVLLDYQQVCRHYYATNRSGSTMGVPIIVQDSQDDRLLRQWDCPPGKEAFKEWQQANMVRAPLLQQLAQDPAKGGSKLANKLWEMTGMQALKPEEGRCLGQRLTALRNVQTQVEIAKAHGMAVIPNEAGLVLTEAEMETINKVAQEQKRHWFHPARTSSDLACSSSDSCKGAEAAGNLAHLIWWHMACMDDGDKAWRRNGKAKSLVPTVSSPPATSRPNRVPSRSSCTMDSLPEGTAHRGSGTVESFPDVRHPTAASAMSPGSSVEGTDEGQRRPKRVVLFSAHDTTLMALAAKLGINLQPPKFGGYLLFELHEGGRVECKYNKDPSKASVSTLRSRQLPQDASSGFIDFDDLPEGSTDLSMIKARCQIKALKTAARRLNVLQRQDSWHRLNFAAASHAASAAAEDGAEDGTGTDGLPRIARTLSPPCYSPSASPPSASPLQGPEGRQLAASLLKEMDEETRKRAEDWFSSMDQHKTGKVSVKDFAKNANLLGVEISPEALKLAAKCFGNEGETQFTRERFLELMALLDQAYLGFPE